MTNIFSFIWTPIFLLFAVVEYITFVPYFCGSDYITGKMWFMWLMMAVAASKQWIDLGKKIWNY
jgi:hypothetical protein